MTELPLLPDERKEAYNDGWIDNIATTATNLLTAIQDVSAYHDIVLPSRQLIYVGTVPKDCEQVAVSVSTYSYGRPGDPGAGTNMCWMPTVATLTAEITRCVPENNQVRAMGRYTTGTTTLPTDIAMEDHARTVMRDMMVLLEAGNVASNYPIESSGSEANVIVADPSGGYQSVFLSLVATV